MSQSYLKKCGDNKGKAWFPEESTWTPADVSIPEKGRKKTPSSSLDVSCELHHLAVVTGNWLQDPMRTICVTVNNASFHIFRFKQMLLHLSGDGSILHLWLDKSNLKMGCGLEKGCVNTSFCVQLVFAFNRKSTLSISEGTMNYHCCQMVPFTSRLELELLILFIYWNIKSLICQLSGPSFIILAVACKDFPQMTFDKIPVFVPLCTPVLGLPLPTWLRRQLPVCILKPMLLFTLRPCFCHAHAAELIKKLAFEDQFITLHHFVIWPLFHPRPKMGVTLIQISFGKAI